MSRLAARHGIRVASNYAQLLATFIFGIVIVRLLVGAGENVFGIYTMIIVGVGATALLCELLRMGMVPVLGVHFRDGRLLRPQAFGRKLKAAFIFSFAAGLLGAIAMAVIGGLVIAFSIDDHGLRESAYTFLGLRMIATGWVVFAYPYMALLVASGRQALFNLFVVLERGSELVGILLALSFVDSTTSEGARLVLIGWTTLALLVLTYLLVIIVTRHISPEFRWLARGSARPFLGLFTSKVGWSSLQTVSMNLFVRFDMVLVSIALGPAGSFILGVAIRAMGYIRQATIGLVNGLDSAFANLRGRGVAAQPSDESQRQILLGSSTFLQALVVFHVLAALLLTGDRLIALWIGDLLSQPASLDVIWQVTILFAAGISIRALNLGWMAAMMGNGDARHFTPALLPAAMANVVILGAVILFAPRLFTLQLVGITFLVLQAFSHAILVPRIAARSLQVSLVELVRPMAIPALLAALAITVAEMVRMSWMPEADGFLLAVQIAIVAGAFLIGAFFAAHDFRKQANSLNAG